MCTRAGMNVTFIDDFLSHHSNRGEIHGGTNMLRQTDIPWWE
jgi:protein-arginine deiminase